MLEELERQAELQIKKLWKAKEYVERMKIQSEVDLEKAAFNVGVENVFRALVKPHFLCDDTHKKRFRF